MCPAPPVPKDSGCPICKAPPVDPFRPFCSRRCANVDLNRWLTGAYAVEAEELDGQDIEELEKLERDGGEEA